MFAVHYLLYLYGEGKVLCQYCSKMPHLLFTSLEDYKARGTQASPYFTVTHYEELADTKGLILVRGDVVFTKNSVEAKKLLEIAHSLYLTILGLGWSENSTSIVKTFILPRFLKSLEVLLRGLQAKLYQFFFQ
ncbi:hypothetical protein O6H91_07G040600 [Diphasiastrum complanatum]|uniref:Uncharacterized protein n=1 Tax=Diphasiastrum complanatum TaxID=34168 RepID=A0ACC2D4P8_DIPCM|nr:hypothetical protein O6H91_07G040600 [Diphasiastrum complanatum]